MDKNELSTRVTKDEDYVRCPKFGNSLTKFTNKNPDGVENAVIARLLLISEDDVERIYAEAVLLLRKTMVP
jgi:hypothetical protein